MKGFVGLEKDRIRVKKPNREIMNYLKDRKDLLKRIPANRYDDVEDVKRLNTVHFDTIFTTDYLKDLKDIDKAAELIDRHMRKGSFILFVSDFDADGISSAAIGDLFSHNVFDYHNVEILVNRREYGRGINNILRDIILAINEERPIDLIVTSDHGSSDKNNFVILKKETDADIIVTDHHLYKKSDSPLSVVEAFVNPQREDSTFSKNITGTAVLYLIFVYTWLKYYKRSLSHKLDLIYYYMTYVGVTTISDCMDLKDFLNRKFVIKALSIINSNTITHNPFWTLARERMLKGYFINETTLSFDLIPMLNTPGRIDNPTLSYKLLTCSNEEEGNDLFDQISILNDRRKKRQNRVISKKTHKVFKNQDAIVMLADESKDLQGIIANRLLFEDNYRTAFVFAPSPTEPDILLGSGRMDDPSTSLKEIIDNIAEKSDIIISSGGHISAVGLKIKNNLEDFYKYLIEELSCSIDKVKDDFIYVDECIFSNKKLITSLFDIRDSGPFGIGYRQPIFVSDVYLNAYRIFEKGPNFYISGRVKLSNKSGFKVGFFYTVKENEKEFLMKKIILTKRLRLVYSLSINSYLNQNRVQLSVIKLIPLVD